ncbi:hypothetical protein [Actinomadura sp. 3N407]|uniref:hypothetical protein n=1 Tax=Actinomadura sp. 3N407 TaxID=3457423 RepID=UPI003FCEA0F9
MLDRMPLPRLSASSAKLDWGDVPTWVSALVAVLTLVGLVLTVIYAHRIYRLESERDERAAEERRARYEAESRSQAEKIAAWFAPASNDVPGENSFGAFVRNASDLPVFDIYPVFRPASDGEPTDGGDWFFENIAVLPPHETKFILLELTEDEYEEVPHHLRNEMFLVEITFRDAAGVRWIRSADGSLIQEN